MTPGYINEDAIRFLEVYMQKRKFCCCQWSDFLFVGGDVQAMIAG